MRDGNRLGCGWRASRWPRRRWWAWTRVVPTAARVRHGGQRSDGVGVVRTCMSPTVVTAHPSTATSTRWARRAARRSRWWRWTCGLRQVPRGAAPKRGGRPIRRSENRALRQQGDDRLAKTRYLWLMRRGNMTRRQRRAFTPLRTSTLQVARAWAIKELAMRLWNYRSRRWQSGCGAAGTAGRFAVGWSRSSESRG